MTKEEKSAKAQTEALIDQLLAKSGITREAVLGEGSSPLGPYSERNFRHLSPLMRFLRRGLRDLVRSCLVSEIFDPKCGPDLILKQEFPSPAFRAVICGSCTHLSLLRWQEFPALRTAN